MTRPTQFGPPIPADWQSVGGDPSLPDGQPTFDCCAEPEDMPNRALDALVEIGFIGGDGSLVQWDSVDDAGGGSDIDYPGDTTFGNLLVCVLVDRGGATTPNTPSGWTFVENAGQTDPDQLTMYWRVAPGGPVNVAFTQPTNEVRIYVMEFDGGAAGLLDTSQVNGGGSTTTYTLPSVTATAAAVLVGAVEIGNFPNTGTFTEDPDFTNVDQGQVGSGLDPRSIVGYRVVAPGTFDYAPTGSQNNTYGGVLAAFDLGTGWVGGGYYSVDGDDATYTEIEGENVIRVGLGAEFAIARIRLVIATETAGARSYTLSGATLPDFSDAVTVATIAFTATGSFTAQTVTDSWAAETYEYWQITGDDETRYIYSFELFEASLAIDTTAIEAALDDHITDTTDAHDASAVSVLDTAGWFTGTNGETVLAEVGARVFGYLAHGNTGATETFDATAAGWHSATLNANCTFTLTGATTGVAAEMVLELLQDGTGGWTITLPASVTNKTELEAAQVTTLSTTSFLILMSRDGGTTWYGFWAGGSGGTDLSAIDFLVGTASGDLSAEIVVGTTPGGELGGTWASPTVDATHAGSTHIALSSATPLVESGSGSAGSGTAASKDDHVHPASSSGGIGPLLLASDHGTPIVFDDILQASDGSDFLYASEP